MDNNGKSKQFFDVSKPGSSPATPNSRSTITNQGTPVTTDPMFTASSQSSEPLASSEPQEVSQPEAPLDLIKPAAFVTHIGDHKKGNKVILGAVIAIFLIAGAAGAYWYTRIKPTKITNVVSNNQPATSDKKAQDSTAIVAPLAKADIPEGYSLFSSTILGYSFAVPTEFGTIKQEVSFEQSNNVSTIFRSPNQLIDKGIIGQLMITCYQDSKTDIIISSDIPSIQLKNNKWVISAVTSPKRAGEVYVDKTGKTPVAVKYDGIDIYSFTSAATEGSITQLAFVVNDKLNVIEIPHSDSKAASSKVLEAKITEQIVKTFRRV